MNGLVLSQSGGKESFDKEYVRERLSRLFFVPEGSVLGTPDWGSQLPALLHEPSDETTADDAINELDFLFSSREPDLELDSVEVSILELGNGNEGLVINCGVLLPSEQEVTELQFFQILEV